MTPRRFHTMPVLLLAGAAMLALAAGCAGGGDPTPSPTSAVTSSVTAEDEATPSTDSAVTSGVSAEDEAAPSTDSAVTSSRTASGDPTPSPASAVTSSGGGERDTPPVIDPIEAARSTPPLIAFSGLTGGQRRIHVMSADGSGVRELPETTASRSRWGAAWSPDGTRIAFSADEARSRNQEGGSDIYVMRADGSDITRLTSLLPGHSFEPAWSPDGTKIAFTSRLGFDSQIAIVNVDGSGLAIITRGAGDSHDPTWSPDGRQIAFTARYSDDISWALPGWLAAVPGLVGSKFATPDDRWHIFVMPADGTSLPARLTNDSVSEHSPAWSPDGSKIAFVSVRKNRLDPGYGGNPEIYVVSARGGAPRTLTDDPAGDYSPSWSPDGSMIAFASGRDWCRENHPACVDVAPFRRPDEPIWLPTYADRPLTNIYVMNADGSDAKPVTDLSISAQLPSFGPTASAEAIAAAPLPPDKPVGLAMGNFPTGDYYYHGMIGAIASADFDSVEDTPKARARVFSVLQQLQLRCGVPDNAAAMRVPLATVFDYAGAPTDTGSVITNFFQIMLDIRTSAEQGDILSAPQRFTGMFVIGGGLNGAAQGDGARLVENLGCGSAKLDQFWRNLGFLIGSRAQHPPRSNVTTPSRDVVSPVTPTPSRPRPTPTPVDCSAPGLPIMIAAACLLGEV